MQHSVRLVAALALGVAAPGACTPEIDHHPRPDVVIADFNPDTDRLPFPFDGLAEADPAEPARHGYGELCDLSHCPEDPELRPTSVERCHCVDFQEWDDAELASPERRAADPTLARDWQVKRRLHRLDGFPVTQPLTFSVSHPVDLVTVADALGSVRNWEGEQQAAANDVPDFVASLSDAPVPYEDPERPGRTTERWLVTLTPEETLLQRKTYAIALKDTVRGTATTEMAAYQVTERYLDEAHTIPNEDCNLIIDQDTCRVFNPECVNYQDLTAADETCPVPWPTRQDAALWFALNPDPLCEYAQEHTDEELLELYDHHALPACLQSVTRAVEDEDAADLEELRIGLNEALDDEAVQQSLEVTRHNVALFWAATTQSVALEMQRARWQMYRDEVGPAPTITDLAPAADAPAGLGGAFAGHLAVPDYRHDEGLLRRTPDPAHPEHPVPFLVSLPATTAECAPPFRVAVVIHGLGGDKTALWDLAGALGAECLAGLALDLPGHGAHPSATLWSADPFLVAGNLEQGVIELLQAVRAYNDSAGASVLERALAAAGAGDALLDGDRSGVIAGSLGALLGTVLLAIDPEVSVGVLSAVAGGWADLLPAFGAADPVLGPLVPDLQAWRLQLGPREIDVAAWALERVDPAAYTRAFRFLRLKPFDDLLRGDAVPMESKKILLQLPDGDSVLPAGSSAALARAFGAEDGTTIVDQATVSGGHQVLFESAAAAAQAARYVASSGREVLR